ncbi:MAG: tyrosine-type recombinase/integrase [Ktedonobacterales bacterium]|nr:tyrosine-type recombinase/integrase [Ktedonobacterales bacterium]
MEPSDYPIIPRGGMGEVLPHSPHHGHIDAAIVAWLNAKGGRSNSERTRSNYAHILTAFRAVVQSIGYDLFADAGFLATIAQGFASQRKIHPRHRVSAKPLAPATYNHTLAVLSSFYEYALRQGFWDGVNPLDRVERRPVESYATAQALDEGRIVAAVGKIGAARLKDRRDFALLTLAFSTGRRVTELASMTIGQLAWKDSKTNGHSRHALTVTFRAKGGKILIDALETDVAAALLDYLLLLYGPDWHAQAVDAPVWVNCSRNPSACGQPLRPIGIAYLFKQHLGPDTHPHQARHSFSVTMDEVHAPLSEIQRRLGHSNIATTSRYMSRLRTEDNPYGADVVRRLGLRRASSSSSEHAAGE